MRLLANTANIILCRHPGQPALVVGRATEETVLGITLQEY
jgi:hypothetical protein